MIQDRIMKTKGSGWILVLGLLLAALMTSMLAAKPAHAQNTFTVTFTSNDGEGTCDSSCTLREAIVAANNTQGTDTIRFGISGSGVKSIKPGSELPQITEAVAIDGYTQPASSSNTLAKGTNAKLLVELDGSGAGQFADGIRIAADNVVVRGLIINRFKGDGIEIRDGASDPARPTGVKMEGNFIGTDASGTLDLGNGGDGVRLFDGSNNTVGGTAPQARNLISGNEGAGVSFLSGPTGNRVQGNLIGTRKDGTSPLGNGDDGVRIFGSSNTTVGGTTPGAANTIAFNDSNGVVVGNGESSADFTGNRVLSNSIFSNARLGMDLLVSLEFDGPTPNDTSDPDTGANDLQNKPAITSAKTVGGTTTIQARLNSTPGGSFTVEFFSNPSGNEGKQFVGRKAVSTNANGNVTFTFTPSQGIDAGHNVTATATRAGNTSEFSAPRSVVAA